MNNDSAAKQLIDQLLTDPKEFNETGNAYQLLQCFFKGFPVETLRPLLGHSDAFVRRSATFVTSEIGKNAKDLVRDIALLVRDPDPHTQWYALESVMVCAYGEDVDQFVFVVRELENKDDSIAVLTMGLMSNASSSQLEAALEECHLLGASADIHEQGISCLLNASAENIRNMLDDPEPLKRKYGAIGAKRLFSSFPTLLELASTNSDVSVRGFSKDALRSVAG